jgi:hypothetical protein
MAVPIHRPVPRSPSQRRLPLARGRVALGLVLASLALAVSACGSSSAPSSSSASASSPSPSLSTASSTATSPPQLGFEGVPIETGPEIGSASTTQTGTVHGISCGPTEQLAYHIHAHLLVYVNGSARAIPGGIGIPGSQVQNSAQGPVAQGGQCIYWLHTHAPDGIIHIESPTQRIYTLGEFFDEWHQPLSATQVGSAHGPVTAIVNAKPWHGSLRSIPLAPHAVIQLAVGAPDPAFMPVSWAGTGL